MTRERERERERERARATERRKEIVLQHRSDISVTDRSSRKLCAVIHRLSDVI